MLFRLFLFPLYHDSWLYLWPTAVNLCNFWRFLNPSKKSPAKFSRKIVFCDLGVFFLATRRPTFPTPRQIVIVFIWAGTFLQIGEDYFASWVVLDDFLILPHICISRAEANDSISILWYSSLNARKSPPLPTFLCVWKVEIVRLLIRIRDTCWHNIQKLFFLPIFKAAFCLQAVCDF